MRPIERKESESRCSFSIPLHVDRCGNLEQHYFCLDSTEEALLTDPSLTTYWGTNYSHLILHPAYLLNYKQSYVLITLKYLYLIYLALNYILK